jgi:hypothetical protein
MLSPVQTDAEEREVATWAGNTPAWDDRLGVSVIRQACELEPFACLLRLKDGVESRRVQRWILVVKGGPDKIERDSAEYSKLSEVEHRLIEIDIDDFVSTIKSWHFSTNGEAHKTLARIINNLKHANRSLRFGITLYEDDLDSVVLTSTPLEIRAEVNRIALYLHYRGNAGNFAHYVAEYQLLFPNAAIWAGSYAYDRIDYLPCRESGTQRCTAAEEVALYTESLSNQLDLLHHGKVAGIEFYPGYFGREKQWNGWSQSRICRPSRISECIEMTLKLRTIAAGAIRFQ